MPMVTNIIIRAFFTVEMVLSLGNDSHRSRWCGFLPLQVLSSGQETEKEEAADQYLNHDRNSIQIRTEWREDVVLY